MKNVGPLSSHFSPVSNAPLPHVGGLWHLLVSNWQFDWQDKAPPMYGKKSVHCLLPKSVPSHCSPASTLLLLQTGFAGGWVQSEVSILHEFGLHFRFPPVNAFGLKFVQVPSNFPNLFPSHSSFASASINPFPHT